MGRAGLSGATSRMEENEVLDILPVARWDAAADTTMQARAVAALESGKVLFLPNLAFALGPAETRFLTPAAADNTRKNISFDPASGRCIGAAAAGEDDTALAAMLDRYGRLASQLLSLIHI